MQVSQDGYECKDENDVQKAGIVLTTFNRIESVQLVLLEKML